MKKLGLSLTERGSMAVELALAAIVVIAVGATIYTARQRSASTTHIQTVGKTTVASSKPNDAAVYANWKTYTSSNEGLTFRYPANWQLDIKEEMLHPNGDKTDTAILTGPSGLKLQYMATAWGLGGGCPPQECPDVQTYSVTKLPNTNAPSDLYLVEGSIKSNTTGDMFKDLYAPIMGIVSKTDSADIPKVGVTHNIFPYYLVAQKHNTTTEGFVMFYLLTDFKDNTQSKVWRYDTENKAKAFFSTPDAEAAKLILASVKY